MSDLFFTPLKCLLEGSIFSLMKDKRKIVDGERGIADDQGEIAIEARYLKYIKNQFDWS